MGAAGAQTAAVLAGLDEITKSMLVTRTGVHEIVSKLDDSGFDMKQGISLLSLKHHLMLSHLQALTLLSCHRVIGESLAERVPPADKFSELGRSAHGEGAGDVADTLAENRIVLEKIKILEHRMKYQVEKLVRLAEQSHEDSGSGDVVDDPLVFRPNPTNLIAPQSDDEDAPDGEQRERSGIYRPPKVAPVPYIEISGKDKKSRETRARVPAALAALGHIDTSAPSLESTTGIGAKATMDSKRARELEHMTRFEEDNMTRLVLNKRDARRRKADEEHIALGGRGAAVGKRRGGGLEDDFGDLLRPGSNPRHRSKSTGDGYDELRERGRKRAVLERSRGRKESSLDLGVDGGGKRKRSRFERDVKGSKRRRL